MGKTLVLVVDRDDDFGVKGKVNTPVVGVQNCLDAATSFGIADPEDSDLNALYAAISVCLELQEDGHEADVALICGDEKVGHRSDLALVAQLSEVLEQIEPDSVVLVGDGAEDEYIYPIISSRAHVDSVRKVYVKQAPGLEGTFYIVTKMLADPDKRKRFLVPLGVVIAMLAVFFLLPRLILFGIDGDTNQLAAMSGPAALLFVGLILIFYGYNTMQRLQDLRTVIMSSLVGRTTSIIFLLISVFLVIGMAVYSVMEIGDLYLRNNWLRGVYFMSAMVWPVIMALELYQVGTVIERLMAKKEIGLSVIFSCLGLASLGLVVFGVLDIMMSYMGIGYGLNIGVVEVIGGIAVSIVSNFLKGRAKDTYAEAVPDEVLRLGAALRGDTRRPGILPRGRRADRPRPQGSHRELRPRGSRRARRHLRRFRHRVRGRAVPRGGHRRRTAGGWSFRLRIERQEAASAGDRAGCRRHRSGRGHPVAAGGQLPRGSDLRARPRRQRRRREDVGGKVRGAGGPHHPVRPGEDRLRFRRVHRRGQGGLHRPGDGMPQGDPFGIRLRPSHAQGGHRSRREAQEAVLGQAHHIVPGRGRGPHGRRQATSRSLSSAPSAIL